MTLPMVPLSWITQNKRSHDNNPFPVVMNLDLPRLKWQSEAGHCHENSFWARLMTVFSSEKASCCHQAAHIIILMTMALPGLSLSGSVFRFDDNGTSRIVLKLLYFPISWQHHSNDPSRIVTNLPVFSFWRQWLLLDCHRSVQIRILVKILLLDYHGSVQISIIVTMALPG